MKMHSQRGRGSAGPRESKRSLNRDEVLGYRDRLMQQPASPERSAALTTVRAQLRSIDRRCTMADVADMANDVAQAALERNIRAASTPIAIGAPGICNDCGDDSLRLVMGRRARCREPKKGLRR